MGLLEQARKFSLASLLIVLDDVLCMNLPAQLTYTPVQETSTESNDSTHSHIYNVILQFESELPQTSSKVGANLVQYLKSFRSQSSNRASGHCGLTYNYDQYSSMQQVRVI